MHKVIIIHVILRRSFDKQGLSVTFFDLIHLRTFTSFGFYLRRHQNTNTSAFLHRAKKNSK